MLIPKLAAGALLALTAALPAAAERGDRVDARHAAAPDALVRIDDVGGTVRVIGWDKPEVHVTGSIRSSRTVLELGGSERSVRISLDSGFNPHPEADLEIHVPAGSSVEMDAFGADFSIAGVTGRARVESVNGGIEVTGAESDIEVETVNGSIEISGASKRVHAESVNGRVRIRGVSGEVEASTVNGSLQVEGGTFSRGRLETVNGSIRFEGALSASASLEIESVGGSVELLLPEATGASFSISSFSGDVSQEFTDAEPRRTSRYTSQVDLHFSIGKGGARVNVHTLSGNVYVRKK